MAQRNLRATVGTKENVLSFARLNKSVSGTNALNLVYQAAEVFDTIEDHAREAVAHAQSLCRTALEKLESAEVRIEAVEQARREIIVDAESKLQDASRALSQAQRRMSVIEDKLAATEHRAQAAEAEAREAKQSLALVEEAIRRRLLCATPDGVHGLSAVA